VLADQALQALEFRARLESELVAQRAAGLGVGLERLGLAPRPVERQHQLSAEPLLDWVLPHEPAQLLDELSVPAEGEVGVDARHERLEALFLADADRRVDQGLVLEIGEGQPAAGE
jgi:hypothetical protein